jgi:hypothetical protein
LPARPETPDPAAAGKLAVAEFGRQQPRFDLFRGQAHIQHIRPDPQQKRMAGSCSGVSISISEAL